MDAGRTNEALELLLARAGWTPENLGDRLNELAARQQLGVRGHRRSPRRWVYAEPGRNAPRIPREPWPSLVCHVLHERLGEPVTLESLGWADAGPLRYVPADHGLGQRWDVSGALDAMASVVDADVMERRQFLSLTGLTLTSVAHQWLFEPQRVAASVLGKRADHAMVDDLQRVADARRRMDDAIGGGTLLPSVREDLRLVVALLRNASYTEDVGKRLYSVAAEFSRLAGWLACDCNAPALAQRYFAAGLRAAHLSNDRAVGANILGFMSVQAGRSPNPVDAVTLAESALTSERSLTPKVAASLHARLAQGAARTGNANLWKRAQSRSFELLAHAGADQEPEWIYWFTQADAEGIAGRSLLSLNQFADAETHLQRAVSMIDPSHSRDRAVWLCHLATARVKAGRVDQACATAGEAATLIRRLDSPHDQRRLGDFRRAVSSYGGSASVRDFDDKHRDLISTLSA